MNAIEVRDVHRRHRLAGAEVNALRGVSLDVPAGKLVAIVGRSGSGKSSLLNVIAGLDRPTSGSVVVFGKDLAGLTSDELARYRRESVGMIFQSFNLIPSMTALDNVALALAFGGVSKADRDARARDALARVGLGARTDHRPSELSGGEQQRVAIARALVNAPRILLADEPTGNLDSQTAEEVLTQIASLVRESKLTVLFVTHDADAAARYAGSIVTMTDGKVGFISESA